MKRYLGAVVLVALAVLLASVVEQRVAEAQAVQAQAVDGSAIRGSASSEQCVTNSAGGTTITVPASARSFELQNLGPNHVSCTIDGSTPTASLGRRIAGLGSGESTAADAWAVDCSVGACPTVKCLASVAAQVTGACVQFTVLK